MTVKDDLGPEWLSSNEEAGTRRLVSQLKNFGHRPGRGIFGSDM
jgi:hypothetical protein